MPSEPVGWDGGIMTPYTRLRLTPVLGAPGRWVVQGWWPDSQVWADIGDDLPTRLAAERKLRELHEAMS